MSGPAIALVVAGSFVVVGCGKLAELAAPNRDVASVKILLPPNILVGDTVQARVETKDADGRPPKGDSTVTWRSSDPSAISVDARGRVTSSVVGAHATISATVQKITGSIILAAGDDQRLGYALADRPSTAAPYSPDPNYRFNSSGGAITVTRASTGVYTVLFAGLGRAFVGQRDNVLVTGYAGAGGIFCKLGGWQSVASDLTADVRCFTPAGAPADSRFTILLSGGKPYVAGSRFGFLLAPDFGGQNTAMSLDTLPTSRNNFTGIVNIGRSAIGAYTINFPGLERILTGSPPPGQTGPEDFQVTAVGAGPERCHVTAVDSQNAGMAVGCTTTGGATADSRFSAMWLTRGRPAPDYRFGYALANQASTAVDYTPNNAFWRNNSGGTITARETANGQYLVTFGGLAKRTGATETVMVTPSAGEDGICTVTSWSNSGTSDLAVNVSCFDTAGNPSPRTFFVLVIQ